MTDLSMRSVKIEDATHEQLVEFAANSLGLDVGSLTLPRVLAAIKSTGYDKAKIQVKRVAEPVEGEMITPSAPPIQVNKSIDDLRSGINDEKVTIFIPKQSGQAGDRPVVVGCNGTHISIPREENVEVPSRYVEVLKHAVGTEYDLDETTNEITERDVMSYPFNIIAGGEHVGA